MQDISNATGLEINIDGAKFRVRAPTPHRQKYWLSVNSGQWERSTFLAIERFTKTGALYIDIGTWIGPTVLYAASRGAKVVGFEPDPTAAAELRNNVDENSDAFRSLIKIVPEAISTESGTKRLYANEFGDSMSRFNPEWERREGLVTLKDFTECSVIGAAEAIEAYNFHDASLIKIDVEGHEYDLAPMLAERMKARPVPVHLSLHPNTLGNSETTPAQTKAARIRSTMRILDAFEGYRIEECEETAIRPVTRSTLNAKLAQTGKLWGPFLFLPS